LKRDRFGKPEDFVPVVIFLCSDAGAAHSGVMVNRHTFVQGAAT
jgi:NAD(P)-dependent dehydrogenase (short-subunit alcohol dehydrogenase family)